MFELQVQLGLENYDGKWRSVARTRLGPEGQWDNFGGPWRDTWTEADADREAVSKAMTELAGQMPGTEVIHTLLTTVQ